MDDQTDPQKTIGRLVAALGVKLRHDVGKLGLYGVFGFSPNLEQEPARILRDEGVAGLNAIAVLEAVGRGARKPSEIASRLSTPQTNISRLLQQLLDASILERELPFGESLRSTKKTQYRIFQSF